MRRRNLLTGLLGLALSPFASLKARLPVRRKQRLKVKWGFELEQDLLSMHGLNVDIHTALLFREELTRDVGPSSGGDHESLLHLLHRSGEFVGQRPVGYTGEQASGG